MDIRYRWDGCASFSALERALRRRGFPLATVTYHWDGSEHGLLSVNNVPMGTNADLIDVEIDRERCRYQRWMKKWRVR